LFVHINSVTEVEDICPTNSAMLEAIGDVDILYS